MREYRKVDDPFGDYMASGGGRVFDAASLLAAARIAF
jgi:hypothetical protein